MSERTWWEAKGKGAYLRVRWTLKTGTSDYSGKVNGNVNYRKLHKHKDPIQVSIHAIGMIDRIIYCGEYKEGTDMVFRNFRIWTRS